MVQPKYFHTDIPLSIYTSIRIDTLTSIHIYATPIPLSHPADVFPNQRPSRFYRISRTVRGLRLGGPMRVACPFLSFFLILASSPRLSSQQTAPPVQRDPLAVTILRQSIAAMAGSVPADSSATGTVNIVEGSSTQNGAIQILTRGTAQTAETITSSAGQRAIIYSQD